MTMVATQQRYVSTGAAARMLGMSRWWVWRRIQTRELEAKRYPGGRYQVPVTAVHDMMQRLQPLQH